MSDPRDLFQPGDAVWYCGRGPRYGEPSLHPVYSKVCIRMKNGLYVVGDQMVGSALHELELHHANDLVRLAREI